MKHRRIEELLVLTGALLALSWTLAQSSFGADPVQSASFAGSPQAGVSQKKYYPWAGDKYRECNQACLYKKANENLTVQMLYTLNLIDQLATASESDRATTLDRFCVSNESGDECFSRYKARAKLALLGVRRSIVENKAMIGQLKVNKAEARGFLPTMLQLENQLGARGPAESAKFAQSPSTMSLEDLTRYYNEEFFRINDLVSRDYEALIAGYPVEPAKEDFIQFTEMKRDSRDPESEVILTPKMNCGVGKSQMCYDEKKFKEASEKYERDIAAATGGNKIKFWGAAEGAAYDKSVARGVARTQLLRRVDPAKDQIGTDLSRKAYTAARRALNRTTRQAREKKGQVGIQKEKGGPAVVPTVPGQPVGATADADVAARRQEQDRLDDEEPVPQSGVAAKDLSVSVQPRDESTDPTAKDSFLEETLAIDPNQ